MIFLTFTNKLNIFNIGALVSKPNLYRGRSWEFSIVNSVDITDSYQSNISIYNRGNEIYRIQPRSDKVHVNSWISDKSRYLIDSFEYNRILLPSYHIGNKYEYLNINLVYQFFKVLFNTQEITSLLGFYTSIEDTTNILNLQRYYGNNSVYYNYFHKNENMFSFYTQYTNLQNNAFKKNFVFNDFIENLSLYDCYLLLDTNIQYELPILYNKLKTLSDAHDIELICFGNEKIKDTESVIKKILLGKHCILKKISIYENIRIFTNRNKNIFSANIENLFMYTNYINNLDTKNTIVSTVEYECGILTTYHQGI